MMEDGLVKDMEAEDFGFHDFETSQTNISILLLSGFKILPTAGGWNDQLVTDADDLLTHLNGLAWARSQKAEQNDVNSTDETIGSETDDLSAGIAKIANWKDAVG